MKWLCLFRAILGGDLDCLLAHQVLQARTNRTKSSGREQAFQCVLRLAHPQPRLKQPRLRSRDYPWVHHHSFLVVGASTFYQTSAFYYFFA